MLWKFYGKAQFPHSFGRFARNYAEIVFPQNFHTRKLGEITVLFAVIHCGTYNLNSDDTPEKIAIDVIQLWKVVKMEKPMLLFLGFVHA